MYLNHFGLAQYPFSLTPNTRYFLKLPSHEQAFVELIDALSDNVIFARITGEVGTGKTMLCRKVLNAMEFHKNRFLTAYIPHPILSEEGIMHAIAEELCLERPAKVSYYDLIKLITEAIIICASEQRSVILFIDEAQAMPEETLEAVHLLTKVDTGCEHQLQVVLFGQPELNELLERPMLGKLKENMAFDFEISPLDRTGTEAYVAHRLSKGGYSGPHMFTSDAIDTLLEASNGVPRLINVLSHKALMAAFGKGEQIVTKTHIDSAVEDTESVSITTPARKKLFGR